MALKKSARADLIGTDGAKTSVASGASASAAYDLVADSNKYHIVGISVVVVFGGTPDGDVTVTIQPRKNTPDEVDTEGGLAFTIPFAISTEKRQSVDVPVSTWDEFDVNVANGDTTDSVDVWVSWTGAYF